MARLLNIACLQTRPQADFSSALTEALALAKIAIDGGAQMIALPEYCGGLKTEGSLYAPPVAVEQEHPVLLGLQEFAAQHKVWTIVGSVAVPGSADKFCNRGFVIDDKGAIQAHYNKLHLFDIALSATEVYQESARVEPGVEVVVFDTPFARLGYSICYDLRFPNLYRELAQAGAEILLVPSAFTRQTGEAHWHVLNRARAIENAAFVLAPCAVGHVQGGGECYGHSLIINPWGEVLADGGDQAGVIQATIDIEQVAGTRRRIPALSHDRPFTITGGKKTHGKGRAWVS